MTKFNRTDEKFYNYNKRNGLKELEFVMNSAAKSRNGTLYFGSRYGLMYFDPDNIKDNYITAPLVFTDLKIFNQSVEISLEGNGILRESISSAIEISIPYENSVVTLEFALLDFFDPKRNTFKYKLDGFDTDWNDVGSRNSATYTNLPPGKYNFMVKGYNTSLQGEVTTSLIINIMPEVYQTWWFRVLVLISLIAATVLFFQLRTAQIKRQNKILEQKVAERTKDLDEIINELSQEVNERKKAEEKVKASLEEKEILLKEIHHRVKNNLQVISSLLYLQSVHLKDEEAVNMFKDSQDRIRCMALVHEKLYQSKNLSEIGFKEYVISLIDYLSRSFNKEDLEIKTIVNIEGINLSIDTAISCGLIINELITNTYKYAFPYNWIKMKGEDFICKFEVSLSENNRKYLLTIKDNGIGLGDKFDINRMESLGLKLVNSLVLQLNGSIDVKNNDGAQFDISFEDAS